MENFTGVRPNFEVLKVEREAVTIRDLERDGRSMTNDVEEVIAALREAGFLPAGRRLLYFHSGGGPAEILWNEDKGFIGFAAVEK